MINKGNTWIISSSCVYEESIGPITYNPISTIECSSGQEVLEVIAHILEINKK